MNVYRRKKITFYILKIKKLFNIINGRYKQVHYVIMVVSTIIACCQIIKFV